jgi:hypothetical protein
MAVAQNQTYVTQQDAHIADNAIVVAQIAIS